MVDEPSSNGKGTHTLRLVNLHSMLICNRLQELLLIRGKESTPKGRILLKAFIVMKTFINNQRHRQNH